MGLGAGRSDHVWIITTMTSEHFGIEIAARQVLATTVVEQVAPGGKRHALALVKSGLTSAGDDVVEVTEVRKERRRRGRKEEGSNTPEATGPAN
jgi:hypothetical protein